MEEIKLRISLLINFTENTSFRKNKNITYYMKPILLRNKDKLEGKREKEDIAFNKDVLNIKR